jgi:hypothetical protein
MLQLPSRWIVYLYEKRWYGRRARPMPSARGAAGPWFAHPCSRPRRSLRAWLWLLCCITVQPKSGIQYTLHSWMCESPVREGRFYRGSAARLHQGPLDRPTCRPGAPTARTIRERVRSGLRQGPRCDRPQCRPLQEYGHGDRYVRDHGAGVTSFSRQQDPRQLTQTAAFPNWAA